MKFRFRAFATSDVGSTRKVNEDSLDVVDERALFVVADGMGGHASGQVASRLAVEHIRSYVARLSTLPEHEFTFPVPEGLGDVEILLSNSIQWANERIFIESMKDRAKQGMGTTVVAVMFDGDRAILGHVGDSRIYRMRGGNYTQRTRDHSLLEHLVDLGHLKTPEDIAAFEGKNVIVKALGLEDWVEPSIGVEWIEPGDLYLLCTDGLSDQVEDWIVENVVLGNDDDLQAACDSLCRLANEAGGKDNCTVMIISVEDAEAEEVAAPPVEDDDDEMPIDWSEDTAIADIPVLAPRPGDDPEGG